MALSRRLFIGGLLAAAAAPAIVTSKGFKPAVSVLVPPFDYSDVGINLHGTLTGRISSSEPAWQEFSVIDRLHPHQREVAKRILFAHRYGTWRPGTFEQAQSRISRPGSRVIAMDFDALERRLIAQRNDRDLFNALKLNG